MNEQKYNNQNINDYLLGDLPEAETERFDELSFTDDEFVEAMKAAENDLIDRYVQNGLTGAMRDKFKSRYLTSPLRREKVEFAKALRVLTAQNASESIKKAVPESKSKRNIAGFFDSINIFKSQNRALQFGFAAVALAFLIFGGLMISNNRSIRNGEEIAQQITAENQESPQKSEEKPAEKTLENSNVEQKTASTKNKNVAPIEQSSKKELSKKQTPTEQPRTNEQPPKTLPIKITVASFFLAPPLRNANQVPIFNISKQTDFVAVKLELESDDFKTYRVALTNKTNAQIWRSGSLKSKNYGENKILSLRFPAKLLKSQNYSLVVSGVNADGEVEIVGNYSFQSMLNNPKAEPQKIK